MKWKILYISAIIALMAVTGCSKSPEQGNEQSNSAISRPKTEITKENKTQRKNKQKSTKLKKMHTKEKRTKEKKYKRNLNIQKCA